MDHNNIPPKLANRCLLWFLRDDLAEDVQGDLEEQFRDNLERLSPFRAKMKYWFQVLNYLRPFAIKNLRSTYSNINFMDMFRHNFIISFRNFNRHKMTFIINLTGLSTGLACALLIYLWVSDELSFDKFHEKDSRLYQVMEHWIQDHGIITNESTSGSMAEALAQEMPEVEYATTVRGPLANVTLTVVDKNIKATGQYVGKDFFNIFSYPIIQGDKNQVWADRNSMMISEALAKKLFNTSENIMGRTVELQHDKQFFISGVFETVPSNSSAQFDFVLSFEEFAASNEWVLEWNSTPTNAYVVLKSGTDVNAFNEKISDYVKIKTNNGIKHRTPFLKRYSEKYLYGKYENGIQAGGRIEYIEQFSAIAIFILVIACINFMNLSTAKASRRLKEVGVKKVIGAGRKDLIFQYLGESLLMTFTSLFLAFLFVLFLLPQFNEITGKQLVLNFDIPLVCAVLSITLFSGLIAGSYPALYLSGFNPASIIKGKLNTSLGELLIRKGLVVFQFTISIILIVSVVVVYKQIEYTQTKNLGYNKDNIILFDREGRTKGEDQLETFLSELRNIPGIVNASSIGHDLTGHNWGVYGFDWEGKDPDDNTEFENMVVYYDMMETLGIEMKEGRTFSREFSSETSKIILNESAIEHMGIKDPIGKPFKFWGQDMQIIGIAKDFHFESLHENIKPLIFRLWPERTNRFMVKIEAGKEKETIDRLQAFYKVYNPGFTLDYRILDNEYQAQYVAEQRVSTLSKYFAGLAILISCLGLFGLVAFTAERRTKEIGIRKIMGADEFRIIRLLSGDFTLMVMISIIIALPVSYLVTKNWLNGFAYRIDLEWWFYIVAGFAALLIAWLTVGYQTIKAARIHPVKCLRDE